ncbi:MAG: hypothetical protein R3208_14920 [Ketobacteraceae bacterium]|nr:hypothetical protein [Ketobacteraceae bacterium]
MSQYDNDYYIVGTYYTPTQFHLSPTKNTPYRKFRYKRLTGGEPVFFENGFKDRDARTGDKRSVTDIMLDGSSLVVNEQLKAFLDQFEIDSMQLYPAVVIDDNDVWHDSYWYLNFYGELDCWDRERSDYRSRENRISKAVEIKQYALDPEILDAIPEERRLLFRMDGAKKAYVFAHKRIVKHCLENAYTGVRFFKVAEFREGDQHL